MKITLSIRSITDGVYALGALHAATHPANDATGVETPPRPALLRREHEASLRRVCRDVFATLALELLPMATACNLTESAATDGDILEIEISGRFAQPDSGTLHALRMLAEAAMGAGVMHLAFHGSDSQLSGKFGDEFRRSLDTLRSTLMQAGRGSGVLRRKTAHMG